jgi:hypothetical protein
MCESSRIANPRHRGGATRNKNQDPRIKKQDPRIKKQESRPKNQETRTKKQEPGDKTEERATLYSPLSNLNPFEEKPLPLSVPYARFPQLLLIQGVAGKNL